VTLTLNQADKRRVLAPLCLIKNDQESIRQIIKNLTKLDLHLRLIFLEPENIADNYPPLLIRQVGGKFIY
jgi:hypothetical protein